MDEKTMLEMLLTGMICRRAHELRARQDGPAPLADFLPDAIRELRVFHKTVIDLLAAPDR